MSHEISRRNALGIAAGAALLPLLPGRAHASTTVAPKGRLKQSVCRWCYGGMSLDDLCKNAKRMGIVAIDLLSENEWATAKSHGLATSTANGPGSIQDGWNRVENHERLIKESERLLPLIAAAGIGQMIVFSGNRRGQSDADGIKNCAAGLKQIMPTAEKVGVTVIMELLNSKVDHGDYQCDRTPWGADLVQAVGSARFKLLYDIYHMQIMEGDVIRTIRRFKDSIAHYHTGGNPGRNEIDETQELNYKRIAEAIAETEFKGYLAHEFIPRKDPMTSLENAVVICTV